MEREILIANTKTQKRSKITTSATTLGELKADLRAAGIDYSNMTFTEGISKTQLLNDDTQLPQNIMYKGQPTNNLVILLTNTKKNISSGAMTRKEAYQAIKDNNLQDAVKEEDSLYVHIVMLTDSNVLSVDDLEELKDNIDRLIKVAKEEKGASKVEAAPKPSVSTSDGSITEDDIDGMLTELGV